jgi:hypothetical protein
MQVQCILSRSQGWEQLEFMVSSFLRVLPWKSLGLSNHQRETRDMKGMDGSGTLQKSRDVCSPCILYTLISLIPKTSFLTHVKISSLMEYFEKYFNVLFGKNLDSHIFVYLSI